MKCCFFFKDQCFLCWYCFSLNTSVNYQASISHNRILFTMIHFHLSQSWAQYFFHPTCPWSEAYSGQSAVTSEFVGGLYSWTRCSVVKTVQLYILYSWTYYFTVVHTTVQLYTVYSCKHSNIHTVQMYRLVRQDINQLTEAQQSNNNSMIVCT